MPRLWTDTVESHRQEVREAILDAAGELAAGRGLLAVSMSALADAAGIGRATLYKYFGDVEEVLVAWHAREVSTHLARLAALAAGPGEPAARLRAVLEAYGEICRLRARHGGEALAAALHGPPSGGQHPEEQLRDLVTGLVAESAAAGVVRPDVPAEVLASFCVAALSAAGRPPAPPAVTLVDLVWSAFRAGGNVADGKVAD